MRKGLTVIEGVVAVAALLLLAGLAIPFFGTHTHCGNGGKEAANLRNIQVGLSAYASSNKGYFPGLTPAGNYIGKPLGGTYYGAAANAGNAAEEVDGSGCTISSGTNLAFACLLEDGMATPAQLVSPGETDPSIRAVAPAAAGGSSGETGDHNHSFAALAYGRKTLKPEWRATANPRAVVLATRLLFGSGSATCSSIWTPSGSGEWKGWTVRNDGSIQWARRTWWGGRSYDFEYCAPGDMGAFASLKYGAVLLDARAETSSVVGIFGRSADMKNFDATPATGMLGSAND